MAQEFIDELNRRKAEQAKLGGFNAQPTAAPGLQPQTPMVQPESVFNAPAAGVTAPSAMTMQTPQDQLSVSPVGQPARAVQAPLTADSLGPVTFPTLAQQGQETANEITANSMGPVEFPTLAALGQATTAQASEDAYQRMQLDKIYENEKWGKLNSAVDERERIINRNETDRNQLKSQSPELFGNSPKEFKPIGEGFSFGGNIPTPADREGGFIPTPEELFSKGPSEFENQGKAQVPAPVAPAPEVAAAPAAGMATPESVANLSVNGTGVVTPAAITEAGQVAPAAVAPQTPAAVAPQAPTASSGGMITRDSTGESFIGGSQTPATPEEVAAFNADSTARRTALESKIAAENPQITQEQGSAANRAAYAAERSGTSGAPVRQTIQDRDRSEKVRETQLRKEGQRSIDDQMREFNNEPHSMKERAAKKAELQGELNKSIKEDKDYTRAEKQSDFARDAAAFNSRKDGGLTAYQKISAQQKQSEIDYDRAKDTAERATKFEDAREASATELSFFTDEVEKMSSARDQIAAITGNNLLTEGGLGWLNSKIPLDTDARQVERLSTEIAGNTFIRGIIESKDRGATFGPLSDLEGQKITAAFGKLTDPTMSNEDRVLALNSVIDGLNKRMVRAQGNYTRKYGADETKGSTAKAPVQGNTPSIPGFTVNVKL